MHGQTATQALDWQRRERHLFQPLQLQTEQTLLSAERLRLLQQQTDVQDQHKQQR